MRRGTLVGMATEAASTVAPRLVNSIVELCNIAESGADGRKEETGGYGEDRGPSGRGGREVAEGAVSSA